MNVSISSGDIICDLLTHTHSFSFIRILAFFSSHLPASSCKMISVTEEFFLVCVQTSWWVTNHMLKFQRLFVVFSILSRFHHRLFCWQPRCCFFFFLDSVDELFFPSTNPCITILSNPSILSKNLR